MKKAARLAAIFGAMEIILSPTYSLIERRWPKVEGLWLVDVVVYLAFGALLVVRVRARWPVIVAAAACVSVIDFGIGGSIGSLIMRHAADDPPFWVVFALNAAVYPTLAVVVTSIGALMAIPFRPIDKMRPSA